MIDTEAENISRADRAGFSVLSTHRLPSSAWWMNYYNPLHERMKQIEITASRHHPITLHKGSLRKAASLFPEDPPFR